MGRTLRFLAAIALLPVLLAAEDRLLQRACATTGPSIDLTTVETITSKPDAEGRVLGPDQAAALASVAVSGRVVGVLVGPAGGDAETGGASLESPTLGAEHGRQIAGCVLAVNLLGVSRIMVVAHARCAMADLESSLHDRVAASSGVKEIDMVFGADIIAGFPTETEEMFARSLDIVDACGLTHLHVFPFSPRKERVHQEKSDAFRTPEPVLRRNDRELI